MRHLRGRLHPVSNGPVAIGSSRRSDSVSYGLYIYGLYSYGLYIYGLYSCGLYSYGLYSYGRFVPADTELRNLGGVPTRLWHLCTPMLYIGSISVPPR